MIIGPRIVKYSGCGAAAAQTQLIIRLINPSRSSGQGLELGRARLWRARRNVAANPSHYSGDINDTFNCLAPASER